MTDSIQQQDASTNGNSEEVRPEEQPIVDNTSEGGDNPIEPDAPVSPRDEIYARATEHREAELAEESGNQPTEPAAEPIEGEVTGDPDEPGEGEEAVETTPAEPGLEPEAGEVDPLADFITEGDDGQPMVQAKVNGREVLIPLDRARAQLQKHEAAEVRLRQAAEREKTLEEREQRISQNEILLQNRLLELETSDLPSPDVDGHGENLVTEAREIVDTLVLGDNEEAAEKLAQVLARQRHPETGPTVDPEQVAAQAAELVEKRNEVKSEEEAIVSGYEKFVEDYPDIMADENLYTIANQKSVAISAEHPDWSPEKVMQEAGKDTMEWAREANLLQPDPGLTDRQNDKRKLTPMPQARSGSQPKAAEEPTQTPSDVIADMRRARGQA